MSWEVWTMKSKTSFFDPTLLKKNISRFAPAWAILQVAMLLAFPLTLMRSLEGVGFPYRKEVALEHLSNSADAGVFFAAVAALLFAALVFKYLHSTKAAYMMHAFPMTRNCMFVTNLVSGLLFYLVPALVTTLCCVGVLTLQGAGGCTGEAWALLLFWTLQFLFFYGLAVFTMHISGRTVIAVLSYAALNFIFLLIPVLLLLLVSAYFYGFDFEVPKSILRLAPIVGLLTEKGERLGLTAVYGGVGAVLLVLAWVHYRCRQVEKAGDAMVYPWSRIAFRLTFTFCCALGLGYILAAFFSLVTDGSTTFLPYALLGCFLGWFGSTMMLERTVKVFRNKKAWLGFAAFAAALILIVGGLKYDVLGFQRRVPETARVESVDLWTDYGRSDGTDKVSFTEPGQIEKLRAIHSELLEERPRLSLEESSFFNSYWDAIHIEYHLSDGTTLRRSYHNLNEKNTLAIAALYADPATAAAWYDQILPKTIRSAELCGKESVLETDEFGNEYYVEDRRECKNPSALRAALLADAAAGRLPVSNSFGNYDDGQTLYHLELEFVDSWGGSAWDSVRLPDTAVETLKLFEKP